MPILPGQIPSSSTFDPLSVAGLVLAVDSSVGVTNTANVSPPSTTNDVSGWKDLGPNGYHLCQKGGTNSTAHYFATGGPTNGPYVTFTNCAIGCCLTNKAGGGSFAQPNTFIMVYMVTRNDSGCLLNAFAGQNEQINFSLGMHMYAGTDFGFGSQPGATNWCVGTFIFNGASSQYRQNGAQFGTGMSIGTGGMPGITLGNYFNLSGVGGVQFAKFYWYNGLTDLTTIHNIEQALATQSGLTIP